MSSLKSKLLDRQSFVLLYGTTPPRSGSAPEVITGAAEKLAERVRRLPLDGFVVYDLQDESSRTDVPRPFPFSPTVDSRGYTKLLNELSGHSAVCYKCIGAMDEPQWKDWLTESADEYALELLSLVGRPSSRGVSYPMTVASAFALAAGHRARFTLGGVAIAEREESPYSESRRLNEKAELGCEFFVSQAVYHPAATIRMLSNYALECRRTGVAPRRIVLTFAPCGRQKTMAFMKWLGIAIPADTERDILGSDTPLTKSIEICRSNLKQILDYDYPEPLALGINTESVSINRDEIDASIDLFLALQDEVAQRKPGRPSRDRDGGKA
jgi:hypothetical protein